MTKPRTLDGKPGPKVNPIPLDVLQAYAECQCTQAEVAAKFGVSLATIEARLRKPEYRDAWERGRLIGFASLRSAQYHAAIGGNPTMMIWMGKQLLGQRDEQHVYIEPSEVGDEPLSDPEWEATYGSNVPLAPTNGSADRPN